MYMWGPGWHIAWCVTVHVGWYMAWCVTVHVGWYMAWCVTTCGVVHGMVFEYAICGVVHGMLFWCLNVQYVGVALGMVCECT